MRTGLAAAGIFAALMVAGCGATDGAPPAPQSATATDASEAALRQRAEAAMAALSATNWPQLYEYQSPRQRTARFPYGLESAQTCLLDQFVLEMVDGLADVRVVASLHADAVPTWSVSGVTVDGEIGQVDLTISINGDPLDLPGHQSSTRWMVRDGTWYREEEDWRDGCPRIPFSGVSEGPDSQGTEGDE